MKVGHAVGISVDELSGGRYRLRWRQDEEQQDGSKKRAQKAFITYSKMECAEVRCEVERAVKERGWWAPNADGAKPADLNLEAVAQAWLRWKVSIRKAKSSTRSNLAGAMKRFFTGVRTLKGIDASSVVPASVLTVDTIVRVAEAWMPVFAEGTIYQTLSAVSDMWSWAADQPEMSGLPRPPYNSSSILPPPPYYEAPKIVPSLIECDAVLRLIDLPCPRRVSTVMRYTGLRLEQVVNIYREDLDLVGAELKVRKGKSRKEQTDQREIPISRHLIADLGEWIELSDGGPLFPDYRAVGPDGVPIPIISYRNLSRYVGAAWEAATKAGEVRRVAWQPPDRAKSRTDHAFRAAFMGFLEDQQVKDSVIDYLVGHSPHTTRGRHYARPTDSSLRAAVESVPPVDWGETAGANVIYLRRACRQ